MATSVVSHRGLSTRGGNYGRILLRNKLTYSTEFTGWETCGGNNYWRNKKEITEVTSVLGEFLMLDRVRRYIERKPREVLLREGKTRGNKRGTLTYDAVAQPSKHRSAAFQEERAEVRNSSTWRQEAGRFLLPKEVKGKGRQSYKHHTTATAYNVKQTTHARTHHLTSAGHVTTFVRQQSVKLTLSLVLVFLAPG